MKKITSLLVVIALIANFTTQLSAQTKQTITTTAGAVLIAPIALTQVTPLHFGTITLTTAAAGTCVLSTVGVRTFTGGLGASSLAPVATNATYTLTGKKAAAIIVTFGLPSITIITGAGSAPTDKMTVSNFLVRFTGETTDSFTDIIDATTGANGFSVGATLTSIASQNAGVYTGTFSVSVDYQ